MYDESEVIHGPYRSLLAAIVLRQVQDFLGDTTAVGKNEREDLRRRAEAYIFDDSEDNDGYLFSFKSVCRLIGLDFNRARAELRRRAA